MSKVGQEESVERSSVNEEWAGRFCYNEVKRVVVDGPKFGRGGVGSRRGREETRSSRRPRKAKISAHGSIRGGGEVNARGRGGRTGYEIG